MDTTDSVFIPQHTGYPDVAGMITYTEFIDSIPADRHEVPIIDWQKHYKTEWRWRFLKFPVGSRDGRESDRHVIEISYVNASSPNRVYLNRYGEWVERKVDSIFDDYVAKSFFVYTVV